MKVHVAVDVHRRHRLQSSSFVSHFVLIFVCCALNLDLLLGLFRFCELPVRMFTRYAGCYPMQDFAGMSPAEKNDWEHVYVLQFFD